MRRFVLGWEKLRLEQRLGSRIVTYADDLVILCKKGNVGQALQQLRNIMSKLKLTVNEEKTRICKVPEGEFDFLGDTFGRMYSARTGQARLGYRPSKKSIKRMVEQIHALTDRTGTWQETTKLVGRVNRTLRGCPSTRQCATVREMKEGPFEFGNQVLISSHRKLLSSKAMVVNVVETSGHDPGRPGSERRAQANRCIR
jgi:RNA-directed DNA polymerase